MKKIISICLCMIIIVSALAGCTTKENSPKGQSTTVEPSIEKTDGQPSGDIRVGFVMKTQNSPYFVSLVESVKELTSKEGWECTVLDSNNDIVKEAENMETLITNDVDLIFLDSVDPSACVPAINKAGAADIPVINLDSGVNESDQCTTIYSNNKENGRMVGKAYADYAPVDKEVVAILLSALKGNIACLERRLGLYAGIIEVRAGMSAEEAYIAADKLEADLVASGKATNEEANFTVRGQGWGDGTREGGLKAAEDLITANKDITCILGENDQMLFGAMTALGNAGLGNVDLVAAADGAKEAYDLIKEGKYFATGENSPAKIAELGMEVAREVLVDGKDWKGYPEVIMTEAIAVTKENVEERYDFGF